MKSAERWEFRYGYGGDVITAGMKSVEPSSEDMR
jgi:hypothetical protein